MQNHVSISKKREFIGWFLDRYELQKREAAWLLSFLSSDEVLLERIHFVMNTTDQSKSMALATTCSKVRSFQYKKADWRGADVETAYYDILFFPHEDLYISLHFRDRETCPEYAAVLEGNPMEKQDLRENQMFSLYAEMILDKAVKKFEVDRLYQEINKALESRDEEAFLQLSEQWRKRLE